MRALVAVAGVLHRDIVRRCAESAAARTCRRRRSSAACTSRRRARAERRPPPSTAPWRCCTRSRFRRRGRPSRACCSQDPSCAMAHWGIAMTNWGNPFAGIAAAKALVAEGRRPSREPRRETDDAARTGLHRRGRARCSRTTRPWISGRACSPTSGRWSRSTGQNPEDREAAAFYALAVNQTALPTDKTYAQQLKAARRSSRGCWAAEPRSSGASRTTSSTPTIIRRSRRARSTRRAATRRSRRRRRTRCTCPRIRSRASATGRSRSTPTSRRPEPRCATARSARRCTRWTTRSTRSCRPVRTRGPAAARRGAARARAPRHGRDGWRRPGVGRTVCGGRNPGSLRAWSGARGPKRPRFSRRRPPIRTSTRVKRFARAVGAARSGKADAARADVAELGVASREASRPLKDADWAETRQNPARDCDRLDDCSRRDVKAEALDDAAKGRRCGRRHRQERDFPRPARARPRTARGNAAGGRPAGRRVARARRHL